MTQARPFYLGLRCRLPKRRSRLAVAALLIALAVSGHSLPARAELVNGLPAAFAVDGLIGAGSLVSIVGNSVDLARGKPSRGWMYSGFILGFMNTAIGALVTPIILLTSGPSPIEYGTANMCSDSSTVTAAMPNPQSYPCGPNRLDVAVGLSVAHSVLGITNLALSFRNAVIWNRQRSADIDAAAKAPASPLASLRVAPFVNRDLRSGMFYGVSLSLSN